MKEIARGRGRSSEDRDGFYLYVMGSPRDGRVRQDRWRAGYWGTRLHVKVGITTDLRRRLIANRRSYAWRIGGDAVYQAVFRLGHDRRQAFALEARALRVLRIWQAVLHQRSERVRHCERAGVRDFARNYSGRSEVFNMNVAEALAVIRNIVPIASEVRLPGADPSGDGVVLRSRLCFG